MYQIVQTTEVLEDNSRRVLIRRVSSGHRLGWWADYHSVHCLVTRKYHDLEKSLSGYVNEAVERGAHIGNADCDTGISSRGD
jgi:hypothetical protein